jgi:hypothetical protein
LRSRYGRVSRSQQKQQFNAALLPCATAEQMVHTNGSQKQHSSKTQHAQLRQQAALQPMQG